MYGPLVKALLQYSKANKGDIMKILLVAVLSVFSLNSMANIFSSTPEEKAIEQKKDDVKKSAEQQEDALDREEQQFKERNKQQKKEFKKETDISKDKVELQKEEALDRLDDQEDKVE